VKILEEIGFKCQKPQLTCTVVRVGTGCETN